MLMDPATFFWILGAVISLQMAVVGAIAAALWVHVGHCKDVAAGLARIEENQKRMSGDIGDHHSGLRGDIREHTTQLFKLDARVESLEESRQELKR